MGTKKAEPLVRTTVRLPASLFRRLKIAAAERSTTVQELLIHAVEREVR